VALPRQHVGFNEHRNTSRVWPVTEQDCENARRALAAFKRDQPALYSWVAEGAPTLTEDQHRIRFGESYRSHRQARRSS
jgi:hypothetical protein